MIRIMLALLLLLAGLPTQHRAASPAPPPLTPTAATALAGWQRKAAACEAPLASMPAAVPAALTVRVEAEQCLRRLLADPALAALPEADRASVMPRIWGEIAPGDAANTAWLKTVIPADGWFRASRDGAETASNAWLIVQHSPDQAFQAEVLRRMAPLARAGEVKGGDYALLYDRVEMFAGRPQYYGSQYRCEAGRWVPSPIRDPDGVEARRKALGLGTMAENAARIAENGGC